MSNTQLMYTGREVKDMIASDKYILSQQEHHKVKVIDDVQKNLFSFTADEDTATPTNFNLGVAE